MEKLEIDFLLKIQSLRSDEENYKQYKNFYACNFEVGKTHAQNIFIEIKKFMTKKLKSNKDYLMSGLIKKRSFIAYK